MTPFNSTLAAVGVLAFAGLASAQTPAEKRLEAVAGRLEAAATRIERAPIAGEYRADAMELLVRPTWDRQVRTYQAADLFKPGTAVLTEAGHQHLANLATWLKDTAGEHDEIVVAALARPNRTDGPVDVLTTRQAEAIVAALKDHSLHKTAWLRWRTITPLGLGATPSPVADAGPIPTDGVQVCLFRQTARERGALWGLFD